MTCYAKNLFIFVRKDNNSNIKTLYIEIKYPKYCLRPDAFT